MTESIKPIRARLDAGNDDDHGSGTELWRVDEPSMLRPVLMLTVAFPRANMHHHVSSLPSSCMEAQGMRYLTCLGGLVVPSDQSPQDDDRRRQRDYNTDDRDKGLD